MAPEVEAEAEVTAEVKVVGAKSIGAEAIGA